MRWRLSAVCMLALAAGVAHADADDGGGVGRDELDEPLTPAAAAARRTVGDPGQLQEIAPDDRWVPWPLVGPFPRIADVCAAGFDSSCATETGLSADVFGGTGAGAPGPAGPARARGRGALREARWFRWDDGCHLAVRTARGWYVSAYVELCMNSGSQRVFMRSRELAIRDVVGDPEPDLYVRIEVDSSHHIDGGLRHQAVLVCGVGASGVPSCTRPMTTWWWSYAWSEDTHDVDRTGAGEVRLRFGPHGVVGKRVRGTLPVWQAPLVGRHPVTFP